MAGMEESPYKSPTGSAPQTWWRWLAESLWERTKCYCSFCGKRDLDVGPLIEGEDGVFICYDCAKKCVSLIERQRESVNTA